MSQSTVELSKYIELNGKYMREADRLMKKRDYPQASGKVWGAAEEMIKAVAAKQGLALGTHRRMAEFVTKLHSEHPDWRLPDKFAHANNLNINFYEDRLSPQLVADSAAAVREMNLQLATLL